MVPCNSGYMQWLYDHTGKRYLDLFAGIVTISAGHCHPLDIEIVRSNQDNYYNYIYE